MEVCPDAIQTLAMHYYKRVIANINAHPRKWAGSVVLVIGERLLEHRLLGWANDRIDEGATRLMPYLRDILTASIAHPWWSLFVLLAAYSIVMIAISHLSVLLPFVIRARSASDANTKSKQNRATGLGSDHPSKYLATNENDPPFIADLSDEFEVSSPDELLVRIRASHDSEIDALLVHIVNRGERTLDSCRMVVESFRSFDSRRNKFRVESAGNAEVVRFGAVRPDYESGGYWFVKIDKQSQQLEIGNTGRGVMSWPPKDPVSTQTWLLTVRLEGEVRTEQSRPQPLPMWRFEVCVAWRKPNTLLVGRSPH